MIILKLLIKREIAVAEMGWSKTFKGEVQELKPGNIRGQYIATIKLDRGYKLIHDIIEGTLDLKENDQVEIYIGDSLPEDLDKYVFCGHGYLVDPEENSNKTILSLWGIIFKFEPSIGLEEEKKYYLCIKKGSTK